MCVDLDNKNLVSVELNLPSCLQVKKKKNLDNFTLSFIQRSRTCQFRKPSCLSHISRTWRLREWHCCRDMQLPGSTEGVVYIISLAYIILMWILSGWNTDISFIGLFSGISQYPFFIKSLIKCPEICQNNFIDLELCWNTIITFIKSLSSLWHISYKYSHLKSDMINIQASNEGWRFLSQGHRNYFSCKYIVITSNSCKEANWKKKISFKDECQWFCESWLSLSFSLAIITSSWSLWLGLP